MPTRISASENINSVQLKNQGAAPSSPASGFVQLYTKGSSLWVKHSDGSISPIAPLTPGGRLTLTTGVPVTTSDVLAATTLYYTPYVHDIICLFDGTADWIPMQFSELSLDLTGYTASKPYDIFAYNNSGVVALESLVWTNLTTRATALIYQNGRLVKSGATTRLYLGTIYMSATGQTQDANSGRYVVNLYNAIPVVVQSDYTPDITTTSVTYVSTGNVQNVLCLGGEVINIVEQNTSSSDATGSAVFQVLCNSVGKQVHWNGGGMATNGECNFQLPAGLYTADLQWKKYDGTTAMCRPTTQAYRCINRMVISGLLR